MARAKARAGKEKRANAKRGVSRARHVRSARKAFSKRLSRTQVREKLHHLRKHVRAVARIRTHRRGSFYGKSSKGRKSAGQ